MGLKRRAIRARVLAAILMMVAAVICAATLVQPAMTFAGGQDCSGAGCDDQIACGQPTQPQASSGLSGNVSFVALPVTLRVAVVECDGAAMTPSPPPPRPASWRFAPSAPRSPPSA
jgi:hypothetical protein